VGLAPIQDGDSEYEFGVAFEIDRDSHLATAAKDRTGLFDGRSFPLGEAIGQELAAWLASGAPMTVTPQPAAEPAAATPAPTPVTTPAPARPTPAAPASPATTGPSNPNSTEAPAGAAPSSPRRARTAATTAAHPDQDAWDAAMAELTMVSKDMPEQTRTALLKVWAADGPAKLAELRKEVIALRDIQQPKTPGAVLAQLPPTPGPAVDQASATFVDGVDPDTDEAAGGISPDQYEALNLLITTYGLNRDALRAYCAKLNYLLPGKNGPTLARMTVSAFTKLREDLYNTAPAPGNKETWSQLRVRRINATPTTAYSPLPAAS
jgi:hypothetical protein